MNLHSVANAAVRAINPNSPATIKFSTGSTVAPDGMPAPTYSAPVAVQAQVQPLTWRELMMVDGLNLAGAKRGIYLFGDVQSIIRVNAQGGDIITITPAQGAFSANSVWLTVVSLEDWNADGWCKVAATLQVS